MPTMGVHKINNLVNECGILHAKTDGVTLEKSKKWTCVKISHGPLYYGIFQFFPYKNYKNNNLTQLFYIDHDMVFTLGCWRQRNWRQKKMQGKCWWFLSPCGCGGTMQGTPPDGAHPGLHYKPLDAAIGQVPAPNCPSGHLGRRIHWKHTKH